MSTEDIGRLSMPSRHSGIPEGCMWELVMLCNIFIYKSDSCSFAVNECMGGNSPVAEGDIA